jgi:hypothetical protein
MSKRHPRLKYWSTRPFLPLRAALFWNDFLEVGPSTLTVGHGLQHFSMIVVDQQFRREGIRACLSIQFDRNTIVPVRSTRMVRWASERVPSP